MNVLKFMAGSQHDRHRHWTGFFQTQLEVDLTIRSWQMDSTPKVCLGRVRFDSEEVVLEVVHSSSIIVGMPNR
jgi:hypothetical protein